MTYISKTSADERWGIVSMSLMSRFTRPMGCNGDVIGVQGLEQMIAVPWVRSSYDPKVGQN